jgi:hypothetical protein
MRDYYINYACVCVCLCVCVGLCLYVCTLSICDICVKQKFQSLTRQVKQNFVKTESLGQKNFINYCKLLLRFWMKFAQLSSIFYGMNESYRNSANIRHFFQVVLTIFTLNLLGFYIIQQEITRNNEVLRNFMKVYDLSQN